MFTNPVPDLVQISDSGSAVAEAPATASRGTGGKRHNKAKRLGVIAGVLTFACLLYIALLAPARFGEYHDDGIYVTTAKAIATGQGYRIISLPFEPAQTKYPPLYAFLLSLIWKVNPRFPQNLPWMMLLSVLAAVSFLAITYRYFVSESYAEHWQAVIVVAMAAFNWRTMTLATGVYSEMVYAAISVIALSLVEKYERARKALPGGIVLGLVLGMAVLTRSSGIALIVALVGYLLYRRQLKKAVLVLAVASVFAVGWALWCLVNKTDAAGVNVAYYTSYFGHFNQVIYDLQTTNHTSWLATVLSILQRNALMLIVVSIPVVCLGIPFEWILYFGFTLLFFGAGFVRLVSGGIRPLYLYMISYLGLHIFWLPNVTYDRFLIPILPFLLLVLIREFVTLFSVLRKQFGSGGDWAKRISAGFIGMALIAVAGIVIFRYGSDLYSSMASVSYSRTEGPGESDAQTIEWINENTDISDVLVCYGDPLYFLYTGRKSTRSLPMRAGVTWQTHQMLIFDIINESNARYLISTSKDFENEYQPEQQRESMKALIADHPEEFISVFQSTDGRNSIYRINSTR